MLKFTGAFAAAVDACPATGESVVVSEKQTNRMKKISISLSVRVF